jgi:hypothetical protein
MVVRFSHAHRPVYSGGMTTQPDEASPPWCVRLISELYAADERATTVAKTLTPQQLNWKARPDEWSVGQCLEHLRIANDVYLRAISNSLVGHPASVVQEIAPGWFGRWFIRNHIAPSPETRRGHAPRAIAPSAEVDSNILDRFLRSNHDAREVIHNARNYDVNRIRFKNPFVPLIRFTIGTGFEILSKHQQRHLLQAERIRASLAFPP